MGLAVDLERSRGLPMRDGEHRDRSLHWPHTNASIAAEWTRGRDVDPVAHQFIHLMRFSFQVQQKRQRHAWHGPPYLGHWLHIRRVRFSIKKISVRNCGEIGGQEMKHCQYADGVTCPSSRHLVRVNYKHRTLAANLIKVNAIKIQKYIRLICIISVADSPDLIRLRPLFRRNNWFFFPQKAMSDWWQRGKGHGKYCRSRSIADVDTKIERKVAGDW